MGIQGEFHFATAVSEDLLYAFQEAINMLELRFYAPGFADVMRQTELLGTDTLLLWESRLGHMRDVISTEITSRKYPPSKGYGPATEEDLKVGRRGKS